VTSAIATVIATIGGFVLIGGLVWAARAGNGEREAEEAARDFYSAHGHWPDEPPPA
jgi:hypothetical protein